MTKIINGLQNDRVRSLYGVLDDLGRFHLHCVDVILVMQCVPTTCYNGSPLDLVLMYNLRLSLRVRDLRCDFRNSDDLLLLSTESEQSRPNRSDWSLPDCRLDQLSLCVTVTHDTMLDYADLFSATIRDDDVQEFDNKKGRSFIVHDKDTIWWCPGQSLQIEDTWVWSTQKRVRIVRHGYSSEDIDARLSKNENDGEEKLWSETQNAKLWRQQWEDRNRGSGYESQESKLFRKRTRRMLPLESKRKAFERRPM